MNNLKIGYAQVNITPPMGIDITGYYKIRKAEGVLDDLYASAVAFESGERRAVIIAVDVCMLSSELCDGYRWRVAEWCALSPEAVFINCSHTHTGPVVGYKKGADFSGSPEYDRYFADSLVECAGEAFADLKNAEMSVAEGRAEGISFVRRFRMKNGNVQTNPGVDNPDVLEALGAPNDRVRLLRIKRDSGDTVVIVSFGTHADTVGGELVSADWPGFVRSTIESALDNTKCVFMTASQGDVNHINTKPTQGDRRGLEYDTFDGVPRGYAHAKHMGRVVAAAVLAGYGKARDVKVDKLAFDNLEITIPANSENSRYDEALKIKKLHAEGRAHELPFEKMELTTVVAEAYRIVELYDGPKEFKFVLSGLSLGDVAFIGMPGECFVDIGRRIEAECDFDTTFVCCLTNGGETYFPTSKAYDEGGYEARSSRLKKGGDDIVVNNAIALSKKLI
jgi:hypothetical protein